MKEDSGKQTNEKDETITSSRNVNPTGNGKSETYRKYNVRFEVKESFLRAMGVYIKPRGRIYQDIIDCKRELE